jgi:hypothetical protein
MRTYPELITDTQEMDLSKQWRLLIRRAPERSQTSTWVYLIFFATPLLLGACNRASHESGVYPVDYHATTLPNVTLTDQFGEHVPLASLKGKAALFDFIYAIGADRWNRRLPRRTQLLGAHHNVMFTQMPGSRNITGKS